MCILFSLFSILLAKLQQTYGFKILYWTHWNVPIAHNVVMLTCNVTVYSVITSGISNRTSTDSNPGSNTDWSRLHLWCAKSHVKSCHMCTCPREQQQCISSNINTTCHGKKQYSNTKCEITGLKRLIVMGTIRYWKLSGKVCIIHCIIYNWHLHK